MNKGSLIEAVYTSDLSDQNKINKIRDYFNSEIQERKIVSKKLRQ